MLKQRLYGFHRKVTFNPILAYFDGMARSQTIGNARLLLDITQLDVINNGDVYAKFLKMARIFITAAALGFYTVLPLAVTPLERRPSQAA
ncbi:hypothetical protein HSBAA_PA_2510 (plasmid) [Vreelandella sulfidaeris]|uniref:Uncharacterized protein n=1 Tax=Vreelandella sulfidaeris TaxID=115553 RepID=A0A455UMV8_9GAMM|nr:hypothetical protein HSBAA_PA_2510 [Halomonas sulfidaeris]